MFWINISKEQLQNFSFELKIEILGPFRPCIRILQIGCVYTSLSHTEKKTQYFFTKLDILVNILNCFVLNNMRPFHIETSQLINGANQLIGFYMCVTLAWYDLKRFFWKSDLNWPNPNTGFLFPTRARSKTQTFSYY